MSNNDFEVVLGTVVNDSQEDIGHTLAITPRPCDANCIELSFLQQKAGISVSEELYGSKPITFLEFVYKGMTDKDLIDSAAKVAYFLRVWTKSTIDVNPEILKISTPSQLLEAHGKI